MGTRKSNLQPLNINRRLHEKVKIVAALSRKGIAEVADEMFMPIVERREAALIAEAARGGKATAK